MTPDQRRHPRRRLDVEVRAKDARAEGELLFDAVDLSPGGAFLRSDLLLEEGETLTLSIALPEAPAPVQAQARVAWVRRFPQDGELAGMGLQFLKLDDEDARALERHLGTVAERGGG